MDGLPSQQQDFKSLQQPMIEISSSSKKKVVQKTVVKVRMEANAGKNKGEGPPSDFWSWRKYGQKPIKGSPYPRGYYKCSTSKGCSAKKQVERCKTDASVLIITYTSNHNHPGPDLPSINPTNQTLQTLQSEEVSNNPNSPKQDLSSENHQKDPLKEKVEAEREKKSNDEIKDMMAFSPGAMNTSEENDNGFFDELEELPMSSSFTSLVRSSIFDERLLLLPY